MGKLEFNIFKTLDFITTIALVDLILTKLSVSNVAYTETNRAMCNTLGLPVIKSR